jgi:hypothetical protein
MLASLAPVLQGYNSLIRRATHTGQIFQVPAGMFLFIYLFICVYYTARYG